MCGASQAVHASPMCTLAIAKTLAAAMKIAITVLKVGFLMGMALHKLLS